jgi:hypothetical protein
MSIEDRFARVIRFSVVGLSWSLPPSSTLHSYPVIGSGIDPVGDIYGVRETDQDNMAAGLEHFP